jgi:hypothetical protein
MTPLDEMAIDDSESPVHEEGTPQIVNLDLDALLASVMP